MTARANGQAVAHPPPVTNAGADLLSHEPIPLCSQSFGSVVLFGQGWKIYLLSCVIKWLAIAHRKNVAAKTRHPLAVTLTGLGIRGMNATANAITMLSTPRR
jgi:hypothetical protein